VDRLAPGELVVLEVLVLVVREDLLDERIEVANSSPALSSFESRGGLVRAFARPSVHFFTASFGMSNRPSTTRSLPVTPFFGSTHEK
jgi:hypothetical protein